MEPAPSTDTAKPSVLAANLAVGGVTFDCTEYDDANRVTGALRDVPCREVTSPTEPGVCRTGLESVAVSCHPCGSSWLPRQTFRRNVVGRAPLTWNLALSLIPGR